MALFFSYALTLLAFLLAIPVFVFFVEIVACLFYRAHDAADPPRAMRKRIAVLVPAHDESPGLRPTLENIKAQLLASDTSSGRRRQLYGRYRRCGGRCWSRSYCAR